MTRSVWKLDGTTAEFDDGRLRARVDLLEPLLGMHALSWGRPLLGAEYAAPGAEYAALGPECGALGIDLGKVADDDLSLPETYARVDDLVATYLQTETRPFRLQAYWRRVEAAVAGATAIELQISINTRLLDTHPSVTVATRMPGTEDAGIAGGDRYRTVRTAAGFAYFEAVHPNDQRLAHAAPSPGAPPADASSGSHTLFGDFLEKGVIVRARIRAAFLPSDAKPEDFDALYDEFVNEPLPLTT